MSTSTEEIQGLILFATSSADAWNTLETSFSSQTIARSMQIRGALQKCKKLDKSITTYYNTVKSLADSLMSIGQPLSTSEFTGYLMQGLGEEYDSLVQLVSARALTDPMPLRDVYAQMLATEQRMEERKAEVHTDMQMSANYAGSKTSPQGSKPSYQQTYKPDPRQQGKPIYPKSGFTPSPQNPTSGYTGGAPTGGGSSNCPQCQICTKLGHVASCCFKRFDRKYLGHGNDGCYMEKQIAAFSVTTHHGSTSSFPVDPSWYADTGATDHLANELDKLHTREQYNGKDHVHTANGAGMRITHIGQSTLPTSSHPLHLNNVLHVPSVTRNLLSVKKFSLDNNVFFEFHPWFFLVKDRITREVLLRGGCRGGLYSLDVSSAYKHVFSSVKVSRSRWHSCLGHPATPIV
jgi:histone deacetylase 1/2